jgi:hypothetical protein
VFEVELVRGRNVVFVHSDHLPDWLKEHRGQMTTEEVTHVAACIQDARPSAP